MSTFAWTIQVPVVRWLRGPPRPAGAPARALVLYDAADFTEDDGPATALWGDALEAWREREEEDYCGYPRGWIARHRERLAEAMYDPDFCQPIFPLGIQLYGGEIARLRREDAVSDELFAAQRIMVDVGLPTLFLAIRRDGASLRLRGADHSHRDGAPAPDSWATMDRAWGCRSFAVTAPWDAFWAAYEAAWAERERTGGARDATT
ncbi:MAG: hypothetical protein R3A79_23825 [Nannocystaceae bacterium]